RQAAVTALALDDEERGRLLAATVAACRLRRGEGVDESYGERPAGRALERCCERIHGVGGDEDVPLRRVPLAGAAARPGHAPGARKAAPSPLRVDDTELALVATLVAGRQSLDALVRRESLREKLEPLRSVARVGVGLGRDGADRRAGPGDDRADSEELRLRGNAPLARAEVAGNDRVGRDDGRPHPQRTSVPPGSSTSIVASGASAGSCSGVLVKSGKVP